MAVDDVVDDVVVMGIMPVMVPVLVSVLVTWTTFLGARRHARIASGRLFRLLPRLIAVSPGGDDEEFRIGSHVVHARPTRFVEACANAPVGPCRPVDGERLGLEGVLYESRVELYMASAKIEEMSVHNSEAIYVWYIIMYTKVKTKDKTRASLSTTTARMKPNEFLQLSGMASSLSSEQGKSGRLTC